MMEWNAMNHCRNKYVAGIFFLWIFAMVVIYSQTNDVSFFQVPKAAQLTGFFFAQSQTEVEVKEGDTALNDKTRPKQACVHPKLEVNDPFMMKFYKKVKKTLCPIEKDWVYIKNGTLYFTPEIVKNHKSIKCDYHAILRDGENKIKFASPKTNIPSPYKLTDDAFKITCKGGDGKTYENMHQGVAFRQSYVDRKQDPMKNGFEGMSIAILGFDSMSRMSWLRRLPITRKYFVEKLGGIELNQHNILGEGTTAVMLPMLTGKFEWELPECRLNYKNTKPMDNFPWIWHDFKKAGYITSWSNGKGSPFNWRMTGFKNPPTDFYSRPFYLAQHPRLSKYPRGCMGSQSRGNVWLKWFTDIFDMYKKQRKFLFNFLTDMSHGDNNPLTEMDVPIQKMVQRLHDQGYLNNTLFILMGDHGARYSRVRSTLPGKLEERLPYFAFLFPPWFLKKYPEAIRNLKINSNRLTTPFDLHATFLNFFKYTGTGMGDLSKRGISLFKEVPLERTCKHAAIVPHWCACLDWKNASMTEKGVQRALQTVLGTINGYTKEYRSDCALLSVANVTGATRMELGEDLLKFKAADQHGGIYKVNFSSKHKNEKVLYQITFYTTPGDGLFEATVKHDLKTDTFSLSDKEIGRINKYGNDCHCIMEKNRQLRQFCYCKDLIKT